MQEQAWSQGITVTAFREPDLGDEITALAFAPSESTRRLLANLRCAGRNINEKREAELRKNERSTRDQSYSMMDTEFSHDQSQLQHGCAVREHYFALVSHLQGEIDLREAVNWILPPWVDEYAALLVANLPSRYSMDRSLSLIDSDERDSIEPMTTGWLLAELSRLTCDAELMGGLFSEQFQDALSILSAQAESVCSEMAVAA